jgi:heat shock protein HtpX
VLAILTPLIATLLQLAISRSREYMADASGAKIMKSGTGLASALAKIDKGIKQNPLTFGSTATSSLFIANPFRGNFLFELFSTHPPMEKRIEKLRSLKL